MSTRVPDALRRPLAMRPAILPKPWGGRRLAALYGKTLPDDQPYGEAWELSDRPEGSSIVASGPLAGRGLRELAGDHLDAIAGAAGAALGRCPLLFKLLDCRQTLSVQVHPDDAGAAALGDLGKEEAWVVLEADADASLYIGFERELNEAEARAAIAEGRLQELLRRVPVRAGDAFHLRPGTVHAIGSGCVLAEIQQSSNVTYRLYDWGRVGLDGQPRELHVEDGLAASDLTPSDCAVGGAPTPIDGGEQEALVAGEKFTLDRLRLTTGTPFAAGTAGQLRIVACTAGSVTVTSAGESVTLVAGRTALLTASVEAYELAPTNGRAEVLLAGPGTGS